MTDSDFVVKYVIVIHYNNR